MRMSVEIAGARELARSLGRDWRKAVIGPRVGELAQVVLDFSKLMVPKRSYKLHDSLKLRRVDDLTYHVTEDSAHGKILRRGSPPHDIYPRNKRALFWPTAEHPVAHVRHPGYRANPYQDRAAQYGQARAAKYGQMIRDDVVKMVG